jgi:glycine/D-amino acid oxidase-like deaminating enzyme
MAERADAVVVGGGIFGASAALHLAQAGVGEVWLLERDGVAQATSAAGAGFVDPWAAGSNGELGDDYLAVENYGLTFYEELGAEDDGVGFRRNGMLWLAKDEEQWQRLSPITAHGAVETKVLEPDEVEALTPIVAASGVVRGVLHPGGGQVSAPGASRAIARRFAQVGGHLAVRRPVTALLVDDNRIRGVDTLHGRILSDSVVLAAGAWTNALLRPHGVFLPMVPLVVSRVVTEPLDVPLDTPPMFIPGVAGGEGDFGYFYLRGENGRLLWGAHAEAPPRHQFVDATVPERFDQLPLDGVEEIHQAAKRAATVVPLLGRFRSLTVAHGAPCYTPDNRSFVGEIPAIEGLYVLAGCNESGVTHAPGFGRVIAERIVHGEGRLAPLTGWRVDRFGDDMRTEQDVVERLPN